MWVRLSHPYLHLCRPGGCTTARLDHTRNALVAAVLIWGLSRYRDSELVHSTGIVPVHQQGDWRDLSCISSDTLVRTFRSAWETSGVCQRDRTGRASRPTRSKIIQMQAVWCLSPVYSFCSLTLDESCTRIQSQWEGVEKEMFLAVLRRN